MHGYRVNGFFTMLMVGLAALCLAVSASYSGFHEGQSQKSDDVVVTHVGDFRVEVTKNPWQLNIYDNTTGELLMHQPNNLKPGFGRWEGEYFNFYPGYLVRLGAITEFFWVDQVTSVKKLPHGGVLLAHNTTSPNTTLLLEFKGSVNKQSRQLNFKFSLSPPDAWNRFQFSFKPLSETEGFFGFGERFDGVNQRGNKVGSWTEDGSWGIPDLPEPFRHFRVPGGKTSSYVPMPLFVSSRGYGFQLYTTFRSEFDSSSKDAMTITTEYSEVTASLFAGRSVRESVTLMAEFNGKALIPPPWVFGPWNQLTTEEKNVNYTQRAREMLLEQKIPVSVAVENLHFFPEGSDRGQHAELLARNQQLLYMGLPTVAYFNAMVETTWNDTWSYLAEKGFFTRNQSGQPYQFPYIGARLFHVSQIDYTNPDAVKWYQSKLQSALDLQYKGWMYDYGEYTPSDSVNYRNQTGLESHNAYPVLYQKACFDLLTANSTSSDYAPDYLFYHRSGYLGSQKYTWAHWTGDPSSDWSDTSGIKSQLMASLSIGLSGIPFSGSDIGGFEWYTTEVPDIELWVRWTQLGAFSGLMHEQGGGKGFGRKTHIFDTPEGTRLWTKFARLRTQLFPYIYTAAHYAHQTAIPIMRHHVLDFGDLSSLDYQYMFGDCFLVAPILDPGATVRTVDLPLPKERAWIDVSSHLQYNDTDGQFRISAAPLLPGGKAYDLIAPLDTIPLMVKSGCIVPALSPLVLTLRPAGHPDIFSLDREDTLHLWVWANGTRHAVGEDWQGNTFTVQPLNTQDVILMTDIVSTQYNRTVTQLALNPPRKDGPEMVQVQGGSKYTEASSWQQVANGYSTSLWFFDRDLGVVWISSGVKVKQVEIVFANKSE